MRAEAHRDMAKYRRKVREKVRSRVAALRAQFDDERESILRMVRDECASILQEARSMLDQRQQQQKEAAAFSSSSSGPLLYPEMISPEQTLE